MRVMVKIQELIVFRYSFRGAVFGWMVKSILLRIIRHYAWTYVNRGFEDNNSYEVGRCLKTLVYRFLQVPSFSKGAE